MSRSFAQAVISAWERGLTQHALDRALTLVSLLHPDASWGDLASLPIGRRDARLLSLHEAVFGARLRAVADCPECGQQLEFQITTQQLLAGLPRDDSSDPTQEIAFGERRVRIRPLNSLDLAEAARADNEDQARARLIERCLVDSSTQLTEEECEALSARLLELDPGAEILIKLRCPACRHSWRSLFDTAAFVWNEVAAEARRLLQQVHELARAYHWTETAILELSPQRRGYYLALVGA
jgi:hypothetical protein